MANGDAPEVGTIGNDGVVGLPLLLGDDRCCRWMLMTHDRIQRTGVSGAAGALQRAGLQERACECCALSKREFDRVLGDPPRREVQSSKARFGRV